MARLTLLGTKGGPALRENGTSFMPSASHLHFDDASIIIDCGLGVTAGMVRAGFQLTGLSHIFLTHYHSDHCLELGGLVHTAWTAGLSSPVKIFGPPGLDQIWDGFRRMMAFDINLRIQDEGRIPLDDLVELHVFKANENTAIKVYDSGEFCVTALRNTHPPVDQSYALRFDGEGKAVCFSGDTSYLPALANFAQGSDILVHEAMLGTGIDYVIGKTKTTDNRLRNHLLRSHSFACEAAQIAAAANVGHLVLNHLIPPERSICDDAMWKADVEPYFVGKCSVGYDGMSVSF
jgi:ribonuclease BN (tRNA processing enzyme)